MNPFLLSSSGLGLLLLLSANPADAAATTADRNLRGITANTNQDNNSTMMYPHALDGQFQSIKEVLPADALEHLEGLQLEEQRRLTPATPRNFNNTVTNDGMVIPYSYSYTPITSPRDDRYPGGNYYTDPNYEALMDMDYSLESGSTVAWPLSTDSMENWHSVQFQMQPDYWIESYHAVNRIIISAVKATAGPNQGLVLPEEMVVCLKPSSKPSYECTLVDMTKKKNSDKDPYFFLEERYEHVNFYPFDVPDTMDKDMKSVTIWIKCPDGDPISGDLGEIYKRCGLSEVTFYQEKDQCWCTAAGSCCPNGEMCNGKYSLLDQPKCQPVISGGD